MIELARQLQSHETQFSDRLKPPETIERWYLDRLQSDILKYNGRFLIAELEGEIAGYVTLLLGLTSAEDPEEILYSYAYVSDLVVGSRHRGKGIGRRLIAECENQAAAAGENLLRLGVLAGNHGAREFYAGIGMQEIFLRLEKRIG